MRRTSISHITAAFSFFAPTKDKKQEVFTDLVAFAKKAEALLDEGNREEAGRALACKCGCSLDDAVRVMKEAIKFSLETNGRDIPEFHYNAAVVCCARHACPAQVTRCRH